MNKTPNLKLAVHYELSILPSLPSFFRVRLLAIHFSTSNFNEEISLIKTNALTSKLLLACGAQTLKVNPRDDHEHKLI